MAVGDDTKLSLVGQYSQPTRQPFILGRAMTQCEMGLWWNSEAMVVGCPSWRPMTHMGRVTAALECRTFPLDIFPRCNSPDISPQTFSISENRKVGRFPTHLVSWHPRVTSQKLSNAIYMQGRSFVKGKVYIFYILFEHTLLGTVKCIWGCSVLSKCERV